jgi:hypothetical protein
MHGGTRISFAVILADGVILDETILDQVRLHHIVLLGKLVLAAIARTALEVDGVSIVLAANIGGAITPPSLNKSIPKVVLSQPFLCLSEFIEKVQIFVTPNEHYNLRCIS